VGPVPPNTRVDATITLKGPHLPTPRADGHALSREEIAKKFGVPKATVQKVTRVLESYKLQVVEVTQGGRSLKVKGSARSVTEAFQAVLGMYEVREARGKGPIREFRAREGVLHIPKALSGIVTGIFGLDLRRMAKRHAHTAARQSTLRPLTPQKLEQQYNFPRGDGRGQTIAIAEFGEDLGDGRVAPAWIPSDVTSFCDMHNRPRPRIRLERVGLSPRVCTKKQYKTYRRDTPKELRTRLTGPTAETMMDAQIVAALCPKADIRIYFATLDEGGYVNLLDAVTSGSGRVPVAVSISWGRAEDDAGWSSAAKNAINERLQIAALQGITVCVSSGDDGSGCYQPGRRCHVEFPSSSPYVLSVGGTMLSPQRGVERVWRESRGNGDATGGGVSLFPRAPWQSVKIRSLNAGAPYGRVVPDVSALAGPPYYRLLFNGKPWSNGGTSAATPLWASLIARIDAALPPPKRQRFLPPLLYKPGLGAAGFRDVVLGHNASDPHPGYEAKYGFDAVSGWGVPDGCRLLGALAMV